MLQSLGKFLSEMSQFENAIKCFDKLIKLDPGKSCYYFNKLCLLQSAERFEEAIHIINKMLELNANNDLYYGKLGLKILTKLLIKNY